MPTDRHVALRAASLHPGRLSDQELDELSELFCTLDRLAEVCRASDVLAPFLPYDVYYLMGIRRSARLALHVRVLDLFEVGQIAGDQRGRREADIALERDRFRLPAVSPGDFDDLFL